MATFADRSGRVWQINTNLGLWKRIKAETGIDLLDIATHESESLRKLAQIENIGTVLWLYVEDQAKAAGVSRDAFWDDLNGPAITAGMYAIVEDLVVFTGSPQMAALRVGMQEAEKQLKEVADKANDQDSEIRVKIREALATL
jgi:hypothetical protein